MSTLPPPIPADDAPPKAGGLAIASLVCSILGVFPLFCIGSLAGLTLGIIALCTAKPRQPKGLAIAGVAVGGAGFVVVPIMLGILVPVLGVAKRNANMMLDSSQLRLVEMAETQYVLEHPGDAPTLGALVKSGAIAPAQLVSRLDERPEAQTPVTADNADRISSYILVPGFKNSGRADLAAVFVDPNIPAYQQKMRGITSVVYEDGHIDSLVPVAELEAALRKQTGMGVQEIIEQQRGQ